MVRLVIPLLVLLFSVPRAAAADFRGISWLMTEDQVASVEGTNAVSEKDLPGQREVIYKGWVAGNWATITYLFENNALLSATYTIAADKDRAAYAAVKKEIARVSGAAALDKTDLAAWRLNRSEIALAHLADGTTYAALWEKSYFARLHAPPPASTDTAAAASP
jgi:hypothetical protein